MLPPFTEIFKARTQELSFLLHLPNFPYSTLKIHPQYISLCIPCFHLCLSFHYLMSVLIWIIMRTLNYLVSFLIWLLPYLLTLLPLSSQSHPLQSSWVVLFEKTKCSSPLGSGSLLPLPGMTNYCHSGFSTNILSSVEIFPSHPIWITISTQSVSYYMYHFDCFSLSALILFIFLSFGIPFIRVSAL